MIIYVSKIIEEEKHKEWKIILKRYKLMENPHSESHSESRFTITKDMVTNESMFVSC